jgi:hypothetical protein
MLSARTPTRLVRTSSSIARYRKLADAITAFDDALPESAECNDTLPRMARALPRTALDAAPEGSDPPVVVAVRQQKLGALAVLLYCGASPHCKDRSGAPALHVSVSSTTPNLEVVRMLCDSGVDVNTRGPDGVTALHRACAVGVADTVAFLVAKGANVAAVDDAGKGCRQHEHVLEILGSDNVRRDAETATIATPAATTTTAAADAGAHRDSSAALAHSTLHDETPASHTVASAPEPHLPSPVDDGLTLEERVMRRIHRASVELGVADVPSDGDDDDDDDNDNNNDARAAEEQAAEFIESQKAAAAATVIQSHYRGHTARKQQRASSLSVASNSAARVATAADTVAPAGNSSAVNTADGAPDTRAVIRSLSQSSDIARPTRAPPAVPPAAPARQPNAEENLSTPTPAPTPTPATSAVLALVLQHAIGDEERKDDYDNIDYCDEEEGEEGDTPTPISATTSVTTSAAKSASNSTTISAPNRAMSAESRRRRARPPRLVIPAPPPQPPPPSSDGAGTATTTTTTTTQQPPAARGVRFHDDASTSSESNTDSRGGATGSDVAMHEPRGVQAQLLELQRDAKAKEAETETETEDAEVHDTDGQGVVAAAFPQAIRDQTRNLHRIRPGYERPSEGTPGGSDDESDGADRAIEEAAVKRAFGHRCDWCTQLTAHLC